MAELQERIRARTRTALLRHGASPAFEDPALFAHVEALLRAAADQADAALLLPELLGEPDTGVLSRASVRSHRGRASRRRSCWWRRLVMPAPRPSSSRDNFERLQAEPVPLPAHRNWRLKPPDCDMRPAALRI
jgi:hypothetical protein